MAQKSVLHSKVPSGRGSFALATGYRLLHEGEELELWVGEVLIGRSPQADLVLDDALVSRIHARLLVRREDVVLQDLDSDNGVYVNERRIGEHVQLRDGDRILIGRRELSFFVTRTAPDEERPSREFPAPTVASPIAAVPKSDNVVSTLQADAFDYLGRIADRMITLGKLEAAERLLGSHLESVLRAARLGENIERAVLDSAAVAALRLALGVQESKYVDHVIELHLIFALPLSAAACELLRQALRAFSRRDSSLLRIYQDVLAQRAPSLDGADRKLAEAILALGDVSEG